MQASVFVPLLVYWRNWPTLPAPLRWLGWYFPLSLTAVVLARGLTRAVSLGYLTNNYLPIIAFNVGKTVLLGLVLRQALRGAAARRAAGAVLALGLAVVAGSAGGLPLMQVTTVARLTQCVVLALVALAYLEQLSRRPEQALTPDPYFWVSVGQLAYSATTAVAISLNEAEGSMDTMIFAMVFVAVAGLVQNFTLTKAYLVGRRPAGATPL